MCAMRCKSGDRIDFPPLSAYIFIIRTSHANSSERAQKYGKHLENKASKKFPVSVHLLFCDGTGAAQRFERDKRQMYGKILSKR